jgi:hypothetical protein
VTWVWKCSAPAKHFFLNLIETAGISPTRVQKVWRKSEELYLALTLPATRGLNFSLMPARKSKGGYGNCRYLATGVPKVSIES